jgi:hypothetical protein
MQVVPTSAEMLCEDKLFTGADRYRDQVSGAATFHLTADENGMTLRATLHTSILMRNIDGLNAESSGIQFALFPGHHTVYKWCARLDDRDTNPPDDFWWPAPPLYIGTNVTALMSVLRGAGFWSFSLMDVAARAVAVPQEHVDALSYTINTHGDKTMFSSLKYMSADEYEAVMFRIRVALIHTDPV